MNRTFFSVVVSVSITLSLFNPSFAQETSQAVPQEEQQRAAQPASGSEAHSAEPSEKQQASQTTEKKANKKSPKNPKDTPEDEEALGLGLVQPLALVAGGGGQAPFFTPTAVDVEPSTGSASLSIPIDVPAGRAGIQPSLGLSYNSSNKNGFIGMGWALELGAIERSVKDGIPNYDNSDTFVLVQSGSRQELVDISGNGTEYRAEFEGAFMKFEYITTGLPRWVATDKKGIKYYFGTSDQRQVYKPNNPSHIYKWMLDKVEDLNGNYMEIVYLRDVEQLYPQAISYTDTIHAPGSDYAMVRFEYETRPDVMETRAPGFSLKTGQRLSGIEVKVGTDLVRKYNFGYVQSPELGRSVLSSVTQVGSDGVTALPATTFTYSESKTDFGPAVSVPNIPNIGIRADSWVRLMDMNGDGLPDVLRNYTAGGYDIYMNKSTGSQFEFEAAVSAVNAPNHTFQNGNIHFYDLNNDGLLDFIYTGGADYQVWANNGTNGYDAPVTIVNSPPGDIGSGTLLMDMNKDGLLDFVQGETYTGTPPKGSQSGSVYDNYKIYFNKGNFVFDPPVSAVYSPSKSLAGTDVKVADFNADGLLDVIGGEVSPYQIWINNGVNGFDPPKTINSPSLPIDWNDMFQLVDMNGDGLTDILEAGSQGAHPYKIYFNDGNLDFDMVVNAFNPPVKGTDDPNVKLTDMNADGLVDVFIGKVSEGIPYQVWLNNGKSGFHAPKTMSNYTPDADLDRFQHTIVDLNGDNLPDLLWAVNTSLPYNKVYPNISDTLASRPDVLVKVDNGIGGEYEITYNHVKMTCLAGNQYKIAYNSTLFGAVKTVTKKTAQGGSYATSYDFQECAWSFQEDEFRGFGLGKVFDADGNYSETRYLQDDIFKGRISSQASYDAAGNLFSKTTNTWENQEVHPGVKFVSLQRKDNYVYDGDADGRRTAEEYFYEEVPQLGNLTKVVQLGEVDFSTGVDIGTDTRTVETQYLNNTAGSDWLAGLPKQTTVRNHAGSQVRKTWFYYDDNLGINDTPTKGLLTKKEDWVSPAGVDNPITYYTYDIYGNLKTTTDPLGRTTTITYDTTYNLFPVITENALTHQVTNEYYGVDGVALDSGDGYAGLWGQLKSTTDPNNQTGLKTYDVFGRPTATVSPLDTVAFPTTSVEYAFTSSYVKVTSRQRINHGQAPTIDSFQFYDGLGRLIQSKTKAETEGQYAVSGQVEYNSRGLPEKQHLPFFSTNPVDTIEAINPANPHTTVSYDAMGRAVQNTNPDGTYATIQYDDWTTTAVNQNGHQQKSYADAYGRLIKKEEYTGADGRSPQYPAGAYALYATTLYTYDSEGNLIQTTDAHNNVTTINYDNLGRKVSMNDPDMGFWQYEYDLNGNMTKQTDAKNQAITFTYDALNRLINKTDGAGLNVTYTYDDAAVTNSKGRLTKADYGANDNTGFAYDVLGRETSSQKIIDALTYDVTRTYDALSRLASVEYPDQSKVYYTYNAAGQIETISDTPDPLGGSSGGGGGGSTIQLGAPFAHFKLNENAADTAVADTGTTPNPGISSTNTANLSQAGKINNAFYLNGVDEYVDITDLKNDLMTHTTGTFTMWVKPEAGKQLVTFTGLNSYMLMQWYPVDQSIQFAISEGAISCGTPAGSVPANIYSHVAFVQDGTGLKIYINGVEQALTFWANNEPGAWFTHVWNGGLNFGRIGALNWTTDPNSNSSFFQGELDDVRYYDFALTSEQVALVYNNGTGTEEETLGAPPAGAGNGLTGEYHQDWAFGGVVLTRTDATIDFNWGTGSPDPLVTADNFSVRWTGQVQPDYSETYTFYTTTDDGVRLWVNNTIIVDKWINQGATTWSGTITLQAGVKYDIKMEYMENIGDASAKLEWESTSQVREVVPTANLFNSSGSAPAGTMFVTNVDYNASGQITKIEYGNGNVTTNTYDPQTLRLTNRTTVDDISTLLQDLTYTYDSGGNIFSITDNVNTASQTFEYDALSRLTQAVGIYGTKTYSYDEIGNLLSKDGLTYTYGEGVAGPHAVTSLSDGTVFTYDANGNMISMDENGVLTEYFYDSENRLVEVVKDLVTIAEFSYDGDGGRTKKIVNGATLRFVGSLYEENATRDTSYVFLGDIRVASVTNGNVMYYHSDHLGGANLITDSLGVVKELTEYKPFGEYARHEKYGSNEEVAWFYFTGKQLDDETGLYYYGARYYNPKLGRFLTADTIVPYANDPQSFNRYSYVRNNPVNLVDPDGHFWFVAAIVGAILGGVSAAITGQSIWKGVLLGAAGGAALGAVGGALAASVSVGTTSLGAGIGGMAIAGAAVGAASSAIMGGDVGYGALLGGLGGALGFGLGSAFTNGFRANGFAGGLAAAGITGAVVGGLGSELAGGSFGSGAGIGAAFSVGGFLATKGVGAIASKLKSNEIVQQVSEGQVDSQELVLDINNKNNSVEQFASEVDAYVHLSGKEADLILARDILQLPEVGIVATSKGTNWNTVIKGFARVSAGIFELTVSGASIAGSGGTASPVSGIVFLDGIRNVGIGVGDIFEGIYGKETLYSNFSDRDKAILGAMTIKSLKF